MGLTSSPRRNVRAWAVPPFVLLVAVATDYLSDKSCDLVVHQRARSHNPGAVSLEFPAFPEVLLYKN
jgi:hypothetical protein